MVLDRNETSNSIEILCAFPFLLPYLYPIPTTPTLAQHEPFSSPPARGQVLASPAAKELRHQVYPQGRHVSFHLSVGAPPLSRPKLIFNQLCHIFRRLRVQTTGTRDFRHHTIVAAPSNLRRDGVALEKLAEWDPLPKPRVLPNGLEYAGRVATRLEKRVEWNPERIMWWLNHGAEPTHRVVWLLEKVRLPELSLSVKRHLQSLSCRE